MTTEKKVERVRFKLSAPHTHAGEDKQPGDEITLSKDQADRLKEKGSGEIVGPAKEEAATSKAI